MEKEAQLFKYERPEFDGVKKSMLICSSDILRGAFGDPAGGGARPDR